MTVAYDLCGYDKTTELLTVEYPVPAELLPLVRTLIDPVPDDHDLVLPYALTGPGVETLAEAMGLAIDPDACHFYFEASQASDAGAQPAAAAR